MEFSVEVQNLTKRFDDFTAVDNVNFAVRKGEIFGFLGPNGAGQEYYDQDALRDSVSH
jgi:ABC-2 type transport system ATP-binding protein